MDGSWVEKAPSVAEWRAYIDGLDSEWQRFLEETCYAIFVDTMAHAREHGQRWAADRSCASVFRGVGKSGLALEASSNPIDARESLYANVRDAVKKADRPWVEDALRMISEVRDGAPKSAYDPQIAYAEWPHKCTGKIIDGEMLWQVNPHPFLTCTFGWFAARLYQFSDWQAAPDDSRPWDVQHFYERQSESPLGVIEASELAGIAAPIGVAVALTDKSGMHSSGTRLAEIERVG